MQLLQPSNLVQEFPLGSQPGLYNVAAESLQRKSSKPCMHEDPRTHIAPAHDVTHKAPKHSYTMPRMPVPAPDLPQVSDAARQQFAQEALQKMQRQLVRKTKHSVWQEKLEQIAMQGEQDGVTEEQTQSKKSRGKDKKRKDKKGTKDKKRHKKEQDKKDKKKEGKKSRHK
ncbi:hypothetical protein HaLaN_10336, partial [Haematococcus lacustris]